MDFELLSGKDKCHLEILPYFDIYKGTFSLNSFTNGSAECLQVSGLQQVFLVFLNGSNAMP